MSVGRQPVATIPHNHKRNGHGQNSVNDARKLAQWSTKLIRIMRGSFRRHFEERKRETSAKNKFRPAPNCIATVFVSLLLLWLQLSRVCEKLLHPVGGWVLRWCGSACGWLWVVHHKNAASSAFRLSAGAKCHKSKRIKRDMAFGKHFPFCEQLPADANDIWLPLMRIFSVSSSAGNRNCNEILQKDNRQATQGYRNAFRFVSMFKSVSAKIAES